MDLRDGFDAGPTDGERALTAHFRRFAMQNQKRKLSSTWVAADGITIAGFVTLCPGSVAPEPLKVHGLRLPANPAPVLVLARMATSLPYRSQGVGRRLLIEVVIPRAEHLATEHGCCGVVAHAKTEAVGFYAKHGFAEIAPDVEAGRPVPMFLPLL
jgi:GNAT superfamily N-acetyltransferase